MNIVVLLIIFFSTVILVWLSSIGTRKQTKTHNTTPIPLSDKFKDISKWKVGDIIRFAPYTDSEMVLMERIISFKKNGVYILPSRYYRGWEAGKYKPTDIAEFTKFVSTTEILENTTLPEREKELDFLLTIQDETSYHNRLVIIQDELEKLNLEFKS